MGRTTTFLRHNKIRLALHTLRDGDGPALLLLHGLGERAPDEAPAWLDPWTGRVYALDFTGHGESSIPAGGGYTAELLMADADIALAEIGPATVLGRGLGAYVALLIAGGRPNLVRGAILCDGPGMAGGGTSPLTAIIEAFGEPSPTTPDPVAQFEFSRDVRPADYATAYARLALQHSDLDIPITVAAVIRPPWLEAVVAEHGITTSTIPDALNLYLVA